MQRTTTEVALKLRLNRSRRFGSSTTGGAPSVARGAAVVAVVVNLSFCPVVAVSLFALFVAHVDDVTNKLLEFAVVAVETNTLVRRSVSNRRRAAFR